MLLVSMRILSLAACMAASAAAAAPQIVLVNANIFTADPARPRAQALAIEDGRIAAVGDNAEIRQRVGPSTRVIDVGGRLVTPGLVEAHVHIGWNLPSTPVVPPGATSDQVLVSVAAAVRAPGATGTAWISGWVGPPVMRDPRNWRVALDDIAPGTPVLLRAFWGHGTIVNSAALKALGVAEDVADPIGGWWGRDAQGRLDGHAYEAAEDLELRAAPPDRTRLAAEFKAAGERYAGWGVTSIHLMNSGSPLGVTLEALAQAQTAQDWTVYAWAGAVPTIDAAWQAITAATPPSGVRVEGPKWVLDGTPLELNALRREPYPNRAGWRGRSNHSDEQLRQILSKALHSPRQLALHVVGDAEADRVVAAMLALAPASAWHAKRVRIEHGDGIRADTLARAASMGLIVVQNPTHFPPPSPALAGPRPLLASLARAGVVLALGSDGGPDEQNPFLNIMLASSYASAPEEALSREQALLAYTLGGAVAGRNEASTGRLMPGRVANLAVLSQDILTVAAPALPATRSLLTLIGGVVVHEAAELSAR